MGGSSSSSGLSLTTSTNSQVTGGGAPDSPTVNAGGSVNIETGGKEVTLASLEDMTKIVQSALTQAGTFASTIAGNQADASAAQAVNDTNLLNQVLQANAQLSQNAQTGGATASISQTNYIIWGLIGLAALALGFFVFRKH